MDEFVEIGRKTGCKVYGCIWFDLGLVSHDPTPEGRIRYAKPKTREMFYAEALVYHHAGAETDRGVDSGRCVDFRTGLVAARRTPGGAKRGMPASGREYHRANL